MPPGGAGPPPVRKRTAAASTSATGSGASSAKRPRTIGSSGSGTKQRPMGVPSSSSVATPMRVGSSSSGAAAAASTATTGGQRRALRDEFVRLFSDPSYQGKITNAVLRKHFGEKRYRELPAIINELTQQSRLSMARLPGDEGGGTNELVYTLVSTEMASKFAGLDAKARMVYQVIERAGNKGIWTKDVRTQTNLQQQSVTKIFKTLESRQLIKPVKSVTARAKKIYMLYHLTPAKELTGGPWYTGLEFDHEFISELRTFVLLCIRKMNGGRGVSLSDIGTKMKQAKVSRVELSMEEVRQLVQTLAYDHQIEQCSEFNGKGEPMFVGSSRVTVPCDFAWWEVLSEDFHFRDVVFEDGVVLKAHEPHHHTA